MKRYILIFFIFATTTIWGEDAYQPSKENLQAREAFQDSKFGLFLHWGIYSVLGKGEWVMEKDKMSILDYELLALRFNPKNFDPAAWVRLAKTAGMKYIVITSKHHDGFAMWGTKQSLWNIVDATPYGKDVLKMLADECHLQGIRLFFYHSHLDWNSSQYYPLGWTGHYSDRGGIGNFNAYLDYMDAQLQELLTGYGEIGGIWFDGLWDKPQANWRLHQTYSLIHRLQPATLVGNNHHLPPFPGEDFQMFEKDLPGQKTQFFNQEAELGVLPLETCDTMNDSWGYNSKDKQFKSTKQLIHYLVKAAGNNSNFLLNVGPRRDGTIQPEFVERLTEMGDWLKKYGDSIYGTRGGPIEPKPWGVTTCKENKVYIHILDWQDEFLLIPEIASMTHARFWPNGPQVAVKYTEYGSLLEIPTSVRDPIDTIIEFER